MTTPKVPTTMKGGSRFYVHPVTMEKLPGVTSVVNMLPKGFLKFWAAKMVAEEAVSHLPEVMGMVLKSGESAAVDFLKRAPDRNTGNAADVGTLVHDLAEQTFTTGQVPKVVHPDLRPYLDHLDDFLQTFQPEPLLVERTVWNRTEGYAGSFDLVANIDAGDGPERVIVDVKTTRSGVHEEVALQLAAYAYAEVVLDEDGTETPWEYPTAGAVLHLRPEGWKLVPVRLGEDTFHIFRALLEVFRWDTELKRSVLGRPVTPPTKGA